MSDTNQDPMAWLETLVQPTQPSAPATMTASSIGVTTYAPRSPQLPPRPAVQTVRPVAPGPEPMEPARYAAALAIKPDRSLLFASVILGVCLIVAAVLFRGGNGGGDDPKPDPKPDPAPKPISTEVTDAFSKASKSFLDGFGEDIIGIGERVKTGDIDDIDEWIKAHKAAYTKREDAFIVETGKTDNEYVPVLEDGAKDFTAEQIVRLREYTIASGKGLKQAVGK